MVALNFNARTVDPSVAFEVLPAGWYRALIDESEMKPTKDGLGAYLQLRFKIQGCGKYANRTVYARLNLKNNNQTAVEIAYADLSAICHAINVLDVQQTEQLHGQLMHIKLKVREAKGEYDASNEIAAYKSINENVGALMGEGGDSIGAPTVGQAPRPQVQSGWGAPQAAPQAAVQAAPQAGWGAATQTQAQAPQAQQPAGWGAQTQESQPTQGGWQPPAGGQPWTQQNESVATEQPAPTEQAAAVASQDQGQPGWANASPVQDAQPQAQRAAEQVQSQTSFTEQQIQQVEAEVDELPPWQKPQA